MWPFRRCSKREEARWAPRGAKLHFLAAPQRKRVQWEVFWIWSVAAAWRVSGHAPAIITWVPKLGLRRWWGRRRELEMETRMDQRKTKSSRWVMEERKTGRRNKLKNTSKEKEQISWAEKRRWSENWPKRRRREGKSRSSKDRSGLPALPQNSAENLWYCRKVLQKVSHRKKLVKEKFCRTPQNLQNFGNPAQLFRPCKPFSQD